MVALRRRAASPFPRHHPVDRIQTPSADLDFHFFLFYFRRFCLQFRLAFVMPFGINNPLPASLQSKLASLVFRQGCPGH